MEEDDLEDDDEATFEEAFKLSQAFILFTHHFQEYVKEMEPDLWKRATDYAMTFTNVEGVSFSYADNAGATADDTGD
jgi:hypothetical protein